MHASTVLQKCLDSACATMHALRRRVLLRAVEALIAGRRLTLIDLARSWPGAERVRAPLKALDRLLGNAHLHRERERVYAAMARWLVRSTEPVIVVDWCPLKTNRKWHLLRAAVPVGGRALTLFEQVFPEPEHASARAERTFLYRLKDVLPPGVRPVLVTDAGFRGPWCRIVEDLGWHWVTRLRHRTLVKPADVSDAPHQWAPCHMLHAFIRPGYGCDLGLFDVARSRPLQARLVLYAKRPQGRQHRTNQGVRRQSKRSRQCARREAEPWLLAASPSLQERSLAQIVRLYRRRMQIELGFRDLKSHRYGHAYEDSLTRKPERIGVLLLIHALAMFAAWLAGLAAQQAGHAQRLNPTSARRRQYSVIRLGWEALARRWLGNPRSAMLALLSVPPPDIIANMTIGEA